MKKIKKIMALMIAMVMCMAMGVTAFAATVTNGTDHTYNVYQIFTGTQTDTSGDTKLGDIAWGTGINSATFLTALQGDDRFETGNPAANVFASATTAKDVAEALASNTSMAKAFANVAAANINSTVYATVEGSTVSPDLPAGYYLFVDSSTIGQDDAANSALLQITNQSSGLIIEEKYDVPSFDKDIVEDGSNVEAVDKAIGDTVTYELTGTLPTNYDDYETYKYVFHDTISAGQAIDVSTFTITLDSANGTDISNLFTSTLTADTDGSAETTFTLTCNNLKTNTSITSSSKIYVRYTVTITANAVIGSQGNSNEGWLEYSNNPNGDGSGTSTTTHDNNLVFTYELNPTKVDGADNSTTLSDAQFILKATNGEHSGKYVQIDAATKKVTGWLDTAPTALETVPTTGNTGVLVSGSDGTFQVYGLDAGTYELTEVKAPEGYNILTSAVTIEIKATMDGTEETGPALTSLTIDVGTETGTTNYASNGILPMTVENNAGSVLPSTGGIGTTIFYIIGAILVIGAGVVLVTRRRMSTDR